MSRSSLSGSESFLDVLIRVNANQKTDSSSNDAIIQQLDKIVDKFGLYVIDFSINKSPSFNSYIYLLCIEACKVSPQKNPRQLQALTQSKSKHSVIIFDGLNCFNYVKFKSLIPDDTIMDYISMVCQADPFNLLITIYRYFSEQAALNIHLKLVVIYCDDLFIADIMEFLIRRKLSLHVILISYNVSLAYARGYYNGEVQGIQFLTIDSTSENICVKKMDKGKIKGLASFPQPARAKKIQLPAIEQ